MDTGDSSDNLAPEMTPVFDTPPLVSDGDAPVADIESSIPETPPLEKEETIYATVIGLVTGVRHIQTKTGGMMLMATVESADFEFRLTIFTRDYETYAKKIEEDKIVVVDGRVRFDAERDEVSISPSGGFAKK